jgi:hypothetical protein
MIKEGAALSPAAAAAAADNVRSSGGCGAGSLKATSCL